MCNDIKCAGVRVRLGSEFGVPLRQVGGSGSLAYTYLRIDTALALGAARKEEKESPA
jgi:hypothetical protein